MARRRRFALLVAALPLAPAAAETPLAVSRVWSVGAQPKLAGWLADRAALDVTASLWWLDPDARDAGGPATLATPLRAAPGWLALAAPGNGTLALITRHGLARPELRINGIALPGQAALLPALGDADLLLAEPAGGTAASTLSLDLRRPERRLAGAGEFAAGGLGSRQLLGRLDVPLAKGVAVALGGQWQHDLGWLANVSTGERLNRGQRAGLSALADLDLAPGLRWALSASFHRSDAGNLPASPCRPLEPARCDGRFTASPATSRLAAAAPGLWGPISADLARQPLGQRLDLILYGSQLAWQAGRFSLALANGFARQSGRLGLDLAGSGQVARQTATSQQHRLELVADYNLLRLGLEAGITSDRDTRAAADTADVGGPAARIIADRRIGQQQISRQIAARASVQATGRLELAGRIALNDATAMLDVADRRPACAPCLVVPGTARQRAQLLTGEASAGLALGEALLFVRSARTARLPGWNLLARSSAELAALPLERGWHHEAGVKGDFFHDHLRLNAALFVDRTRSPVSPLLGLDPGAAVNPGTAMMRNHGLDVWASIRPLFALELAASLALQQARWQGAAPAGGPPRPLFAPDASASLAAAWHQPLPGAGADLVPRLAARWRSAMPVAAASIAQAPGGMAPAGWQIDAALQLDISEGGWLVSLECDNCLDATMVDGAVAGATTLNRPRWWQLRFLRRF
ncbi:MAG: TonB-dependent receptor [Alphaproteobacteria bacterium]|nr:TonB-dependent receptor [Alphaproteobacteria bacterium]